MEITVDNIVTIMTDCPVERAQKYVAGLNSAMEEFEINTPTRMAAFIAQISHESGEMRYTHELWGPTKAQKGYEGRLDLGNTETGDGFKFRGRGFIQITGRTNYKECGGGLDVDLISNPDYLAGPEGVSASAAWFWKTHGLNELADNSEFETITRRINGGLNGYDRRVAYWNKAKEVLGVS